MKKKTIFIMLLSALLLTACAKDQEETGKPFVQTEQGSSAVQERESQKPGETVSTVPKTSTESTEEEKEPEPEKETTEASQSIPESTETSTRPKDTEETKKPEKNNSSASQSKPANTGSSGSSGSNSSTGSTGNSGNTEKNSNGTATTPHTACTYDGGKITKAADCNNEGVKTYTCTACGKTKTEAVAKTSHNYTTSTTAATCTANGSMKTYCTICGNVQSETTTAATGHSMHEEWFNPPTCLAGGMGHVNKCSKCGYSEGLPNGEALGHVPDAGTMWDPPDCCHEGHASHVCTRCNANLSDTVIPANPDAHDWHFDKEYNEWYCDNGCGATK